MTATAAAPAATNPPAEPTHTTITVGEATFDLVSSECFICHTDDAEPIAVGQDFEDYSRADSFLAVCCPRCGLVYLNPVPVPQQVESPFAPDGDLRREGDRICRKLGNSPPVLHVRGVQDLDGPPRAYKTVLLTSTLERAIDPLRTLVEIRQLLEPAGIALILTPNTEATVCNIFRGRHWSGYNFPRHRNLFCRSALRQAANIAGFEIVSIGTAAASEAWLRSMQNLMMDWRFPHWSIATLRAGWRVALMLAGVVEGWQQLRGKGGLLLAIVRRPAE